MDFMDAMKSVPRLTIFWYVTTIYVSIFNAYLLWTVVNAKYPFDNNLMQFY